MDQNRIAENLATVEAHFHSEAENEVMAALRLYTDESVVTWRQGRTYPPSRNTRHAGELLCRSI